jgi:heme a synthase
MNNNAAAVGAAPQTERASVWMFGYSAALAACTLGLIILGAAVTTGLNPVPGETPPPGSGAAVASLLQVHMAAAVAVSVLVFGLSAWLQLRETRAWVRGLGWSALAVVLAEGWLGTAAPARAAGFLHALLAHVLFSILVATSVGILATGKRLDCVPDSGRVSLRTLAVATSSLALLQVILGAAYRHGVMGMMLHILNAMIVVILVLVVCLLVTRQFPEHTALKPAAVALAVIAGTQVALGFATLIILLVGSEGAPLLFTSVAHAATGALTLAASVVLAIVVRGCVQTAESASSASGAAIGD